MVDGKEKKSRKLSYEGTRELLDFFLYLARFWKEEWLRNRNKKAENPHVQ